jgi:hypothetical protein
MDGVVAKRLEQTFEYTAVWLMEKLEFGKELTEQIILVHAFDDRIRLVVRLLVGHIQCLSVGGLVNTRRRAGW